MSHDLPLIVAIFAPVVVLSLLGINAAVVFLSLCLGEVLVTYVSSEAISALTTLSPHASALSKSMLQLAFLLGPAILSAVIMVFSVRGMVKRVINVLPALGVGLLGTLMGVPLFTPGLRYAIEGGSFWQQLTRAQALVVGVTALISLLFLWSQRRSAKSGEGRSTRHRG